MCMTESSAIESRVVTEAKLRTPTTLMHHAGGMQMVQRGLVQAGTGAATMPTAMVQAEVPSRRHPSAKVRCSDSNGVCGL